MSAGDRSLRVPTRVTAIGIHVALVVLACTTVLPGCSVCCKDSDPNVKVVCFVGFPPGGFTSCGFAKAESPDTQVKLTKTVNDDDLKSAFVAIQAKRGANDADSVTVLPVFLLPGFRADVTCGVFAEKLASGVDGGLFGLEIRGADPDAEFYAIYAERSAAPEGLTVRAVTHDGIQGAEVFLAGADRVDLSAFSTGATITLSYRLSGGPSQSYSQLAAVNVVTQGPYQPATAIYDIDSKGQVGFSNLDIPISGVAAKPKAEATPIEHARGQIMQGVLGCMSGLRKLNSGPPSQIIANSAEFDFSGAMNSLQSALADLETFQGPSAEKAKKALDAAWKLAGKTGRALGVDPPEIEIPRQLKGFANKFFPLIKTALENIARL